MKRRELEQRLSRAVRSETPDVLEKVLTLCEPNQEAEKMAHCYSNNSDCGLPSANSGNWTWNTVFLRRRRHHCGGR